MKCFRQPSPVLSFLFYHVCCCIFQLKSSTQPTYNHNYNKQKSTPKYHSSHHSYHSEKTQLHYAHTFHNELFDYGGGLDHRLPRMGRCVGRSLLLFLIRFCRLVDRWLLRCSGRGGMRIEVCALIDFPFGGLMV